VVTDDELARAPRWPADRLAELPGKIRGDLVGAWGDNVTRRFGAAALGRVRARVPALPTSCTKDDWLPAGAQVAVTEAIVDDCLGGEWAALYPCLVDDVKLGVGRVKLLAVRAIGAVRALRMSPGIAAKVYDRGTVTADVSPGRALLAFAGHPLFANQSWRLLQLYATRSLLELAGAPASTLTGTDRGADGFDLHAAW
jgi:hypothetical protein